MSNPGGSGMGRLKKAEDWIAANPVLTRPNCADAGRLDITLADNITLLNFILLNALVLLITVR
jgi:hypothetical protein